MKRNWWKEAVFTVPGNITYKSAALILSNYNSSDSGIENIVLRPYEARVYRLI